METIKNGIIVAGLIMMLWLCCRESPARWTGRAAPNDPRQSDGPLPSPWKKGDLTIEPLAKFEVEAVVLSTRSYDSGREGELSPIDLALGWGPMSEADVLNQLKISQEGRWYYYQFNRPPPIPQAEIAAHSANTHCAPADEFVKDELMALSRHDVVTLSGYLIEARGPGGYHWRSSTSRTDRKNRACELLWVTKITCRPAGG